MDSKLPPLDNTPEEFQACKDSTSINGRMPYFTSFNHGMENWLALACRERQLEDALTRLEKAEAEVAALRESAKAAMPADLASLSMKLAERKGMERALEIVRTNQSWQSYEYKNKMLERGSGYVWNAAIERVEAAIRAAMED